MTSNPDVYLYLAMNFDEMVMGQQVIKGIGQCEIGQYHVALVT